MKNKITLSLILVAILALNGLTALDAAAAPGNPNPPAYGLAVAGGTLSAEESAALAFMYEEEKLARDVYQGLYAQWKLMLFQNIAASEQTHLNAVKTLLVRYGQAIPADTAGSFSNPDLQALYNTLIGRGKQSLVEALKVGGAIEEIDILDLQKRLAQTDQADIQQVFTSLLRGSENHLRAFARTLEIQSGESYLPQYLSAEAYQAILSGASGRYGTNGVGGYGRNSNRGGYGRAGQP